MFCLLASTGTIKYLYSQSYILVYELIHELFFSSFLGPCSGSFEVQVAGPARTSSGSFSRRVANEWRTVFHHNRNELRLPLGLTHWPEVIGTTTTLIELETEVACSGLRIIFHRRQKHWNNHAIVGIEGWCRMRENDRYDR